MITVRLWTGQVLEFPDDTPQEVMRQAAERVSSGSGGGANLSLDHLRRPQEPDTYDLSRLADPPRRPIQGPPRPIQGPPDFREWQPDPNSPMRERRSTGSGWEFRPRAGAMGSAIPAVGRVEGGTPERSTIRRMIDASASRGPVGLGLSAALDVAETIPEALGVTGTTALDANVQVANTGRLPLRAAELLSRKAVEPYRDLTRADERESAAIEDLRARGLNVDYEPWMERSDVPDPLAPVVDATTGWREEATQRLAEGSQHLPTPVAAGVFHAATTAGLLADASNLIGGEAKSFGTAGRPMTEIEQAAAARSGKYLPGAEEPWIYLDDKSYNGSPGWKGRIPDTYRSLTNRPWREYGPDQIPLERPSSIPPRPRSVERDPLPLPPILPGMSGTDEDVARIAGLWNYASRRYPTIASRVKRLELGRPTGGSYFHPDTGTLSLSVNADLGTLMHELGHVAQDARGQLARPAALDAQGMSREAAQMIESQPTRLGDVYSRIQQPSAARVGREELVPYEVQYGIVDGWGTDWNKELDAWELHVPGKEVRYFQGEGQYDNLMETLKDEYIKGHPGLQRLEHQGYEYFGMPGDLPPSNILEATYPWTEKELIYKNKLREAGRLMRQAAFGDSLDDAAGPSLSGGEVRDLPDVTLDVEKGSYRVEIPGQGPRSSADLPDLGRTQPTGITGVFHQNPSREIREQFPDAIIDSRDAYPGPVYTGPDRRARPFQAPDQELVVSGNEPAYGSLVPDEAPQAARLEAAEGPRRLQNAYDGGQLPEYLYPPSRLEDSLARHAPVMYRETSANRLADVIGARRDLATEDVFLASSRDLAIGQGDNRGILLEFDASQLKGVPHQKPGLAFTSSTGGGNEFRARMNAGETYRDSLRAVEIDPRLLEVPYDRTTVRGAMSHLESRGWIRSTTPEGRIRIEAPSSSTDEVVPSTATQSARLEAAEREAFLREPLPPKPWERGSVGAPPDPTQPQPPPFQSKLPEEYVAERLGWKVPDGPPRATTTPPIRTPDFQTNLASQVGGPEMAPVADYIVQRSDEVYAALGPPETWDTLEFMAARHGRTKEEFLSQPSHWNVLPPEARLRLTYVIKGNEQDIANLQSKLAAGTATDADKAELLRHINTREDLIKLGAQTGSAYGRALNSLKIEARLALGDDVLLRQKLYREYSKQLDAEKPLMETLARLDPNNPEELQAFLRVVNRPKWHEYAQEYWVSSILSGLATHERNLIGNSVNAVLENAVVRPISAGFDAARVAGTGADRAIYLRETPAAVVGLTRGIRQGVRKGLEVLKRGYDPTAMQGKLFPVRSAFARSQNHFVREIIGPVATMPLRMLAASDALFKTMNYTAEIYAQAARIASKEALSGDAFAARVAHLIGNPTDEMIDAADAFALKATFNDEASAIGKAVMGLRDLPGASSTNPGLQAGLEAYRAGMGFILPFVKIADRLMVRGFEYTPLGIPMAVGARRTGNFAEAADLAARSSIGSVVLAYAASLAMEGRLSASSPSDEGEKAAKHGSRWQPWSVRTDDGVWIPYGGMQPIGTPFAIAAAAWKGWQENDEAPDIEKLGHAAQQIGVYVTDQSYMDGLSKFMDAIGGSDAKSGRAFSDLATNTAWGFHPYSGMTRSIARGIDPRLIDAETIGQRLKQNVPFMSLSMDARLTPWGEDVVPVGGRLRSVLAPGSILLPSREKLNPLDQELDRLGMPLGYVGKSIADKFGEGKSRGTWKLNQSEWYMYQQTAGRASKLLLERLYSRPGYPEWDIEHQREETQKAIEAARKYARIVMVRYHRGQGLPGMNPRLGDVNAAVNPLPY